MAHFVEIDSNNVVLRGVVVSDNDQDRGQDFLAKDLSFGGTWLQTSYNTSAGVHRLGGTPFRKNYAGVGYTYDAGRDAFIPPKPYPSWILNEFTCCWDAPTTRPSDSKLYNWVEDSLSWVEYTTTP